MAFITALWTTTRSAHDHTNTSKPFFIDCCRNEKRVKAIEGCEVISKESEMANNGQSRTRFLAQHRKKSVSVLTRALYRNVRGITISAEVRKQGEGATCRKCGGDDDKDDAHLTYGEIRVESFDLALSHASNYCSVGLNDKGKCDKQRNVFYDLGSGTGKALFAAAFNLHHPFDACVGLEIMPELSVMNEITSQLQSFDIVYTPTGVTID